MAGGLDQMAASFPASLGPARVDQGAEAPAAQVGTGESYCLECCCIRCNSIRQLAQTLLQIRDGDAAS
jgi:hypothetical protein